MSNIKFIETKVHYTEWSALIRNKTGAIVGTLTVAKKRESNHPVRITISFDTATIVVPDNSEDEFLYILQRMLEELKHG